LVHCGLWVADSGFHVSALDGKKMGLLGTIGVSTFVVVADSLTVLDLPSVPGIPKFAAAFEITYSLLIVIYLLQRGLKRKAAKSNHVKH